MSDSAAQTFLAPRLRALLLHLALEQQSAFDHHAFSASDAALYFDLREAPAVIAAHIATALRDDVRTQLRRRVRQEYTWEAIYRRGVAPLLSHSLAASGDE